MLIIYTLTELRSNDWGVMFDHQLYKNKKKAYKQSPVVVNDSISPTSKQQPRRKMFKSEINSKLLCYVSIC